MARKLNKPYNKYTVEDMKKVALKEEDSIFSNWFYRHISIRCTRYLLRTNIKPYHITNVSLFFGLISSALFLPGTYLLNWIGVFFMHFAFMIDHIDGEIARVKPHFGSKFGIWLDQVADRIKEFTLFGAITIGVYVQTYDPIYLIYGMVANINLFMISYVRSTAWFADLKTSSDVKIGKRTHLGFIDTTFFLITIAVLFDELRIILIGYAILGALLWIYQLIVRYFYAQKQLK